jgi:hypothetical protein
MRVNDDYPVAFREAPRVEAESFTPSLLQFREPRPDPLVTAENASVRSFTKIVKLDIIVVGGHPRVIVAAVEGREAGSHRVEVYPGHNYEVCRAPSRASKPRLALLLSSKNQHSEGALPLLAASAGTHGRDKRNGLERARPLLTGHGPSGATPARLLSAAPGQDSK